MALSGTISLDEIARDTRATRGPLNDARHVPGYIYNSPEIFRLEKEVFFMRDWICAGRVEEFAKPGDYKAFRLMDEPFVIARDKQGELHAFSNICLHRGVEVVTGEGNVKEFSCPYHAWLYDLDGRLIGAPYMKEAQSFDPAKCRLATLRLSVWGGLIFVTFNSDGPSLEEYMAPFAKAFGFFRMEDCSLVGTYTTDLDCNWKFVNENLMDVYHFQTLHIPTFGAYLDSSKFEITTTDRGGISAFDPAAPITPSGETALGRMPWIDPSFDRRGCMGFLPPLTHIFGRCDAVQPLTVWPLAPDKTRIIIYHLVPKHHLDNPNFKELYKPYYDTWVLIAEEDRSMVQSLQRNMGAARFRPGPMSHLERTVHNIVTKYLDRLLDAADAPHVRRSAAE